MGLLDAVRRHDMRMVGPNCLGITNTDPAVRLDATFAEPAPAGAVGLVTQSGGVAIAVQTELRPAGAGRVDRGVDGGQVRRQRQRHAAVVARRRAHPHGGAAPGVVRQPAQVLPLRPTARRAHAGAHGPVGQLRGRAAGRGLAHRVHGHAARDPRRAVPAGGRAGRRPARRAHRAGRDPVLAAVPAGRRTAVVSERRRGRRARRGRVRGARPDRGAAVRPHAAERCRGCCPRGAATANPVDTSAVVPPEVFASAVSAVRADPGVDAVLVGHRWPPRSPTRSPASPPRRRRRASRSSRSGSARRST